KSIYAQPKKFYLQAVYRVLHYLKGAPEKGILFQKSVGGLILEAYTDADYVGSMIDRRFISGYCTFLGGNLASKIPSLGFGFPDISELEATSTSWKEIQNNRPMSNVVEDDTGIS
ncbi:hypothetical protein Pfo_006875, partial [Paulownia fortunei]